MNLSQQHVNDLKILAWYFNVDNVTDIIPHLGNMVTRGDQNMDVIRDEDMKDENMNVEKDEDTIFPNLFSTVRAVPPLDEPLSTKYPDIVGEFDAEEQQLICDNAYDLVLMEQAAELTRQVLQHDNVLDHILQQIVKSSSDTHDSQVCVANIYQFHHGETLPLKEIAAYKKYISQLRKKCNTIIGIFSLILKEGGHFAAYIYQNNEIILFDSMQIKTQGYYSVFFQSILERAFDIKPIIPDCILGQYSPQYTGGFFHNLPYILIPEVHNTILNTEKYRRIISHQYTASQNHYCYMWSIFYIHYHLLKNKYSLLKFEDWLKELYASNIDTLIVIKTYIINIINYFKLYNMFGNLLPWWKKHFYNIWLQQSDLKYAKEILLEHIDRDELNSLLTELFQMRNTVNPLEQEITAVQKLFDTTPTLDIRIKLKKLYIEFKKVYYPYTSLKNKLLTILVQAKFFAFDKRTLIISSVLSLDDCLLNAVKPGNPLLAEKIFKPAYINVNCNSE